MEITDQKRKMVRTLTGVDSLLEELEKLEIQSAGLTVPKKDEIHAVQLELRFLKMLSWRFTKCEETGKGAMNLVSVMSNIEAIFQEKETGLLTIICESKVEDLVSFASSLLEKVEHFKPGIREICAVLLDSSLRSKCCSSYEILEFTDCVVGNLKDILVNLKVDIGTSLKNQIRVLEEKLNLIRNLVDFVAKRCIEQQKLEDFLDFVNDWMNKAACLSLLCWLDGDQDENMAQRLDTMVSDLLLKIKPHSPKVPGMFIGVLKASKSLRSEKALSSQIVASLIDFLLEDIVNLTRDSLEILREGLTFLIVLVMDPPQQSVTEAGNVILAQIDASINEAVSLICSLYMGEIKDDISAYKDEIEKIRAEIRDVYVHIPNTVNFSTQDGIGFVQSLLQNLKEVPKCLSEDTFFEKHKVVSVQEELLSLEPFLQDILEVQNEHEDLNSIRERIIKMAHQADRVISSCSTIDNPIWHDMLCLSDISEEIHLIKIEVKKFKDQHMHNISMLSAQTNSSWRLPFQVQTSRMDETIVGFQDEAQKIIDQLTRGSTKLDIISIVGMPGLGKTTLAKKVYNDTSVKYHFNGCAWCCVSQVYKRRELLFDILSDLTGVNARDSDSDKSDEDLAEKLWKCLKGRRYLIVMDDIWDDGAWDNLKRSLPDDNKGSRILFTSRICDLACQTNSLSLRPFFEEESWRLLQKKLFQDNDCPQDISEVGKEIARNCKGLPLAIVVVAGVLARERDNLAWWKEIEASMRTHIASEGCMDILELSYKHLPHRLRRCFLYFGAFPEDKVIRVGKLMKLWMAEGFAQITDVESSYDEAEECLMDLIDRSLIMVERRSTSRGRIKTCRIHDLLRDLCLSRIKEEKFLKWIHEHDAAPYSLNHKEYHEYRLCVDSEWNKFMESMPMCHQQVQSLMLFGDYSPWFQYPLPSAFFNSFKLLKVLDLECIYFNCSFPEEMTLIIHLRYLAIWCFAMQLPSSIANLLNLESLVVKSGYPYIPLPHFIFTMKSLRHVHVETMDSSKYKNDGSSDQFDSNIETLSTTSLDDDRVTEEILKRFPRLRKLKCIFPYPKYENANPSHFPMLSSLSNLNSLKMSSYGAVFNGEHSHHDGIFPAFDFPSTLRKLTLGKFRLPWHTISPIGKLPNLEVLKLRDSPFSGETWTVEDGEFQNLKFLELGQSDNVFWEVCSDPFPCLVQLVLRECYKLEEIPLSFGDIATLEKIEVYCCPKATSSARQILEEQQDMGNDILQVHITD